VVILIGDSAVPAWWPAHLCLRIRDIARVCSSTAPRISVKQELNLTSLETLPIKDSRVMRSVAALLGAWVATQAQAVDVTVAAEGGIKVNPLMYGLMFEEISYGAQGGL